MEDRNVTFESLGVAEEICEVCTKLNWLHPTKIQEEAIPLALQGKDIIGLAETGSGKTGAFAIPILQALLNKPQKLFAVILTPTRELAHQIAEHFDALGQSFGLTWVVLVGGISRQAQKKNLLKRPNIIIATPGRLLYHLQNTEKFKLDRIKYLVLDEADKMLRGKFSEKVTEILNHLPEERITFLYSATLSDEVKDLWENSMKTPAHIEVSPNTQTVDTLQQYLAVIPSKYKEEYLYLFLKNLVNKGFAIIVFCNKWITVEKLALLFKRLIINAIPLHGRKDQLERSQAVRDFKSAQDSVLIATDVASRGLDLSHVDIVINYDAPDKTEDYVHRVGRTARAGREGRALTLVSSEQDAAHILMYEKELEKKIKPYVEWPQIKSKVVKCALLLKPAKFSALQEFKEMEDVLRERKRKHKEKASKSRKKAKLESAKD